MEIFLVLLVAVLIALVARALGLDPWLAIAIALLLAFLYFIATGDVLFDDR